MNYMHTNIPSRLIVCVALFSFAAALNSQAAAASGAQAATAQSAQPPVWKSYSYSADGFSASFPSAPTFDKKNVPTDAGTFELRSYIVADGEVAMFIGICDYFSKTNGQDPDVLLQGAKNGALQNSNSHLLSETKTTLGDLPRTHLRGGERSGSLFRPHLYGGQHALPDVGCFSPGKALCRYRALP